MDHLPVFCQSIIKDKIVDAVCMEFMHAFLEMKILRQNLMTFPQFKHIMKTQINYYHIRYYAKGETKELLQELHMTFPDTFDEDAIQTLVEHDINLLYRIIGTLHAQYSVDYSSITEDELNTVHL